MADQAGAAAAVPAAQAAPQVNPRVAEFAQVLVNVVGLTAAQAQRLIAQGRIPTVDDLAAVEIPLILEVFPATGNNQLSAMGKMKLKALHAWAWKTWQDQGDGVDVLNFTNKVCLTYQRSLAMMKKDEKPETSKSGASFGYFSGKASDWRGASRKLLSYLGQQRGHAGEPLSYVLRDEEDRPEEMDEAQRGIWTAPLRGSVFERDNYIVFQILQQWTSVEKSTADTYVDQYSETCDGRGAYFSMRLQFEGDDARQTAISRARRTIKLHLFCGEYGLPRTLITDNAKEEMRGEWEKVVTRYLLKQRTTEPHSGWQNKAEIEIRELKKHYRRIMHRSKCPEAFWCYGMEYIKEIRKVTAKPTLDWRTPIEVLTGETPDCSEKLEFDLYGWVKYKDPKALLGDDVALGRWLGVAHDVGQAMTYWVLKANGYVVARSSVRPLMPDEKRDENEKQAQAEFMKELREKIGDFDPELINVDDAGDNDEMCDPVTKDHDDADSGDGKTADVPMGDDITPGPEPLLHAEVFLPHGDRQEIAKVIGRKRNADGNFVGRKHQNPILDSRVFVVEFPDGDQKDVAYNVLAEHLFSQVDSEGNQYRLFKEIVNHQKKKTAVDKSDQFRIDHRTGRATKKKTTAGWDLEVEWRDGSTSWLPLRELKETNAVEVAQYAVDNRIDEEPAFDWWAKQILKKKERLIKASQRRHLRSGYKFGIKMPSTVEEALALDAENKNTLWYDAIQKEMGNVKVAFEVLAANTGQPPPGYKRIPCRMIFDIKMDFTRKARLVAGGHLTDPPTSITYSSVVTRESVRIAFTIAALNGLDICAADVGNAYLNAKTTEKVYVITGPEFGDEAGRIALVVRALYGLKSSGAAWHAHFANTLTDLGFLPCRSDPDV